MPRNAALEVDEMGPADDRAFNPLDAHEEPPSYPELEGTPMTELELGCCPIQEEAPIMGGHGYWAKARRECKALIRQLRRLAGQEPWDTWLYVKSHVHEGGPFLNLGYRYPQDDPMGQNYAQRLQDVFPERWDDQARRELGLASTPRDKKGHAHFPLGRLVITQSAMIVLDGGSVWLAVGRHSRGEWGDVPAPDHAANERALVDGGRLFSAHQSDGGRVFWIITECDRSVTTVLLPEDY